MRVISAILSYLVCLGWMMAAHAGDRMMPPQCFSAQELAAVAGEKSVRRGDRSFDGVQLSREIVPIKPIAADRRGAIRRVDMPNGEKLIALTLDLCEQTGEVAGYDGAIFDYLRREGVKATIFVGGKWMRSHQMRATQLVLDPLFELANHSDTHRNLRLLDTKALRSQILGPQHTFAALRFAAAARQCVMSHDDQEARDAPGQMTLFRFPFGACNQPALDAVNDAGLLAIQWDVSTGDPAPTQSASAIARAMISRVRPGSIIIAHANGRGWNTAAALPIAIPKLKAMGYRFVTVSELLRIGTPVISKTCYDFKPGDTDRYDFMFSAKKTFNQPVTAGSKAVRRVKPVKRT